MVSREKEMSDLFPDGERVLDDSSLRVLESLIGSDVFRQGSSQYPLTIAEFMVKSSVPTHSEYETYISIIVHQIIMNTYYNY